MGFPEITAEVFSSQRARISDRVLLNLFPFSLTRHVTRHPITHPTNHTSHVKTYWFCVKLIYFTTPLNIGLSRGLNAPLPPPAAYSRSILALSGVRTIRTFLRRSLKNDQKGFLSFCLADWPQPHKTPPNLTCSRNPRRKLQPFFTFFPGRLRRALHIGCKSHISLSQRPFRVSGVREGLF